MAAAKGLTARPPNSSSSSSSETSRHRGVAVATTRTERVGMPRRFRQPVLYVTVFAGLSLVLLYQLGLGPVVWPFRCPDRDFIEAMARRASPDRFIVLALVDAAFADMAINLYEAHLRPNRLENFLFVGAGRRACAILWNASLPCHHYAEDADAEIASVYLSRDFMRKMNIRTDMILDALNAGFTVLHTDLDVAMLRNPLPDIKEVLLGADLAALWDSVVFNAGFVAVRPTPFGIQVYELMKKITSRYRRIDDQRAMNMAISRMRRAYQRTGFRAAVLDRNRYLCGYDYFERDRRWFPVDDDDASGGGCDNCSVIHNNWIVSKEAKIYRFKEHLMWMNDEGGYYSNRTRRYLTYSNPVPRLPSTVPHGVTVDPTAPTAPVGAGGGWEEAELRSLRTALAFGRLLRRVVILPRFHCIDGGGGGGGGGGAIAEECPLNSLLNISAFDAAFAGAYRENSFLRHPLVPPSVSSSRSRVFRIQPEVQEEEEKEEEDSSSSVEVLRTASGNVTADDVIGWFDDVTAKILVFDSLLVSLASFGEDDEEETKNFEERTRTAFRRSGYRQLK